MKILECLEPNNNVYFLSEILNDLNVDKSKYKWVIADLDLIPVFHGDYSGIGGEETENEVCRFLKSVEQEKVIIVNVNELYNILNDTQTVRSGVFICLNKQDSIDVNTYRPKVECNNADQRYDERAKYEVRILDGSLFFVL